MGLSMFEVSLSGLHRELQDSQDYIRGTMSLKGGGQMNV